MKIINFIKNLSKTNSPQVYGAGQTGSKILITGKGLKKLDSITMAPYDEIFFLRDDPKPIKNGVYEISIMPNMRIPTIDEAEISKVL